MNRPAPSFEVVGARAARDVLAPTLLFELEVEDDSGLEVFTISLAVQIAIEPAQRRYDREARERLTELLGDPDRIGAPTRTMPWTRADVLVQTFRGRTAVEVPVLCNFDLEVAATKYFHALADGEVPLVFHFNGGVYYRGPGDRIQIVQLSWEESSSFRLPVATWRELIDFHYPGRGWLGVSAGAAERLRRYKLARGLPSSEAALESLLDLASDREAVG